MTSADFSAPVLPSCDNNSLIQAETETSPGNAQIPSRLCLPHLHICFPCKNWTLEILDSSSGIYASYVIPVRQTSVLPSASFRFRFATDTLAVQLTLPLDGRVEDLHLQVSAPCRAHQKKYFIAVMQ